MQVHRRSGAIFHAFALSVATLLQGELPITVEKDVIDSLVQDFFRRLLLWCSSPLRRSFTSRTGLTRAHRIIEKPIPLPSKGSEAAVAYQLLVAFVPQAEGERLHTGEQRQRSHALKERLRSMALLEVVVGNTRTQMMDVMKADVA